MIFLVKFYVVQLFSLLLLFSLANLIQSATYYCIAPTTNTANQLECAAGRIYDAIGQCCTQNVAEVAAQRQIPDAVKELSGEPPPNRPEDCDSAVHFRQGNKFDCIGAKRIAYKNWHPSIRGLPFGICCEKEVTEAGFRGERIPPNELRIDGRDQQGIPQPQPFPAPPPTTRRPLPPVVPFRPPRPSALCRDLNMPGRPSDCPANAQRCNDPMWRDLMAQQCPLTCNLCGSITQQSPSGVLNRHIGGGRGCRDWIAPSGHMTCQEMVGLNYCQNHRTQMMAQCPSLCGFC